MLNTPLPRLSTDSIGGLSSPTVNWNHTRLRLQNLVFCGANACSDRKVMQLAGIVARIHRTGTTGVPLSVGYLYTSTGDRVSDSRGRGTIKAGESSTDITIRTYRDAAINESNTVTFELDADSTFQWGHPDGKSSPAFVLHATRDTSRDTVIRDTGSELGEVTRLLHKSWHIIVTRTPTFRVANASQNSPCSIRPCHDCRPIASVAYPHRR